MSVQPTLPDKQDQAYPPFELYQPVGRNTRCRNAVLPIAIPGLAECAKRLNNLLTKYAVNQISLINYRERALSLCTSNQISRESK